MDVRYLAARTTPLLALAFGVRSEAVELVARLQLRVGRYPVVLVVQQVPEHDDTRERKNGLLALDAVVLSRPIVIRPIAQEVRRLLLAISGRATLRLYYRDSEMRYPDSVVAPGLRGHLNVVGQRRNA